MILLYYFLKILICFSLIKCFLNDQKRYSSHLQVSILHRVAPTKIYLTIYESLTNSYLKKVFVPFLGDLNPRAALYEDKDPGIEVGLELY